MAFMANTKMKRRKYKNNTFFFMGNLLYNKSNITRSVQAYEERIS